MPERYNSQRTLLRATYVPTKLPATPPNQRGAAQTPNTPPNPSAKPQEGVQSTARVMAKVAFIRGLNIRGSEYSALSPQNGQNQTLLLESMMAVSNNLAPQVMDLHSSILAGAYPNEFGKIARNLATLRADTAAQITDALRAVRAAYANATNRPVDVATTNDALAWAYQMTPTPDVLQSLLALVQPLVPDGALASASVLLAQLSTVLQEAMNTNSLIDNFLLSFSFEPVGRIHLERIEMIPIGVEHGELVYSVPLTPHETVNLTHREWSETTSTFEQLVGESFEGYSEKGVTEKTDVSTAVSTETKHSSSFDANAAVNFSYNGNPYSLTTSAAVDYGTKSDDAASLKDSRSHSMAVTRMASARTRREHKQSFKVSSVAGTEDLAVRVLTNPSDTNALRIDYFRLMRKWEVDLIRYGLRMTYDLVIPNPGNALAVKLRERDTIAQILTHEHVFDLALDQITSDNYQQLAAQYVAEVEPPPRALSDLSQSVALQATGDKWQFAGMTFSVEDGFEIAHARLWAQYYYGSAGDSKTWFAAWQGLFQNEGGPDGAGGWNPRAVVSAYDTDLEMGGGVPGQYKAGQDFSRTFNSAYVGQTGQISIEYMWYHVDSGQVDVTIKVQPTAAAMNDWRLKAWNALRQADDQLYQAATRRLMERVAQLDAEIAAYDDLTLRRMEREEIMRLVLVWLFGPNFQFVPTAFELLGLIGPLSAKPDPLPETSLDPGQMTLSEWDSVRKYGDFIKYIHNAVEWENVLFFMYPYFWDLIENWPFKRFLSHPDFDHRNFLRAGSARVVIPVRPGFERSFAQLVEHFTLPTSSTDAGGLPADHPYVSIGQEMRDYAMTNYEHTPPANPDKNVRPLLYPSQQRAWTDMQVLIRLLEDYNADHQPNQPPSPPFAVNFYPSKLDGLKSYAVRLGLDLSKYLNDPWGRPYVYKSPGDNSDYDLLTSGKDGPAGGTDPLDQPITSWAEGNVVGRWYEYTPTSALDVGMTVIPPSNFQLPTKPEPA